MTALSYRELVAWQKAIELVRLVYASTKRWPREETYGLTAQIRRAAVSVASNIAEGQGRGPTREFQHHLRISYGSLMELETQAIIARDLGYLDAARYRDITDATGNVGRLLNGLMTSLAVGRLTTDN